MSVPENLKYTQEHEWVKLDESSGEFTLGISDYAQDQLGDIVYVELPEVGQSFKAGESLGVLESTKSVSDYYCPIDAEVIAVNSELESQPELINEDPYEKGYLVQLKTQSLESSQESLQKLLNAADYNTFIKES